MHRPPGLLMALLLLMPGLPEASQGGPPEDQLVAIAPQAQEEQEAQPEEPARPPQPVLQPPPVSAAPPAPVTLGEFVVKVAAGLQLPAPPTGFTAESAAWALVQRGIKVRAEMGTPMTEADAVAVLTGLGYKVRTATPSRVMTRDRADLLIETFIVPGRA